MSDIPEIVEGLPNLSGHEAQIEAALKGRVYKPSSHTPKSFRSAFACALHMHQPMIPAGGGDLATADVISNLKHMMDNQGIGDNHNAGVFHWCYKRCGDLVPEMIDAGQSPRIMLEYTGCLLYGLRKMGLNDVFDNLHRITTDDRYSWAVEWLGAPWGHPVAPSTPVQDYRLHVKAWQHHFASLFGLDALKRVRGFSPSEMALPNHPDIAYEYIKTLVDCGYQYILVQEHTVEEPASGQSPQNKYVPQRLQCRNSKGEVAEILAIIKTQGSDTKLVAQMQPYYEAKSRGPSQLAGRDVPPLVFQIADGENGGVMMNEFPPKFKDAVRECSGSDVPMLNGAEYLDHIFSLGIKVSDLPVIQPVHQKKIWERYKAGDGAAKMAAVIETLKKEDHRFNMEGGSWTNDISWVKGYDSLLGPMERVSSLFYEKVISKKIPTSDRRFRNALYHLLCSQTSCYRYWGQGIWVDYGKELCRRAESIIKNDF